MVTASPGQGDSGRASFTLLSDQPSKADQDQLGYNETACQLADAIKQSRQSTPLTIGIEGEWGSGKSTLIGCLREILDQDPGIDTIWFNAWTAEGRSALEGLIKSVLYKLDRSVIRKALRKTKLLGMARLAVALIGSWIGVTRVVDVVWERGNVDARTRNELRDLVSQAVSSWLEQYSLEDGRLLVVFIDDLDRASPDQVFEVFEAIKLYLDVPGFVFVIGYDSSVIHNVVERRVFSGRSSGTRGYLDKIIQISYALPPPDNEQAHHLLSHYTRASNTDALFGQVERALVVDRSHRNPRRMKRFINSFVLVYGLDPDWREIGPESLVEVLLLEMHFPEFFNLFRARAVDDPVSEFSRYRVAREQLLADDGQRSREKLQELEQELPEDFPLLLRNADFVALVDGIRASRRWPDVLAKLARRDKDALLPTEGALEETSQALAGGRALLWIDDDPTANQRFIGRLRAEGWRITHVQDGDSAFRLLSQQQFDVIVSDCERNGDREAGLEDMRAIRQADLHQGAVVFFTLRVTPELRAKAAALNAIVTNKLEELYAAVLSARRS